MNLAVRRASVTHLQRVIHSEPQEPTDLSYTPEKI